MLFSDSLPQLWLSYGVLSLVVLVTGYLGVRLLPLLPRLVLVGVVAGGLWMVAPFSLPLLQPGETYSGLAPAIVVMAVGVLQRDGGQVAGAFPLLLVGAAVGAALGVLAWRLLRRRRDDGDDDRGAGKRASTPPGRSAPPRRSSAPAKRGDSRRKPGGRREPVVG
ncbi:hypothetical protein [Salinicola peritrichatus]|uniref:hypothetical protein n=1 Tax=Salinicola peritrichatus TaxID=1267424 RepID=UPI00195513B6|nr:hypothetical protein [Salinicola peritrichatus]